MPGLIDSLGSLLGGSEVDGQVSGQVDGLNLVISAVQVLIDGPEALSGIENAAGSLPLPPGLDGIANLASGLGSLNVPTGLDGALAPMLAPLTGLSPGVAGSAGAALAAFDLVREIINFSTGRSLGGSSGLPDSQPAFRLQDMPSAEEMRAALAGGNQLLDGAGPRWDAARILQLLQRAAAGFQEANFLVPKVPFLDDFMEALGTVAAWQAMSGAELSAHFSRTLSRTAELMASPRRRIAQPIVDAGAVIGGGQRELAELNRELAPVMTALRQKATVTGAQPTSEEVAAVERAAALFGRLAAAMDAERSPLAEWSLADERLTRHLLNVIRALEPAYSLGSAAVSIRAAIEGFPPPADPGFETVAADIEAFDVSVLTDPLRQVTEAVRSAVDEVNGAKETVRRALESALSPVGEALDTALEAAHFADIRAALDSLPARIQDFVDAEITPNLASVRDGVSSAVAAVSGAADRFDPEALIAPIRKAVEDVAALLQTDSVRSAFAQVEEALETALRAIEELDLSVASDQCIDLIGGIETKVSAIDPSDIPDSVKPLLNQAVQVVTDIDFTAEVGGPVLEKIEQAAEAGPAAVLGLIEGGMDELRENLERFRPSTVIGAALDEPFERLLGTLREFKPSDLLDRLQQVLDSLAGRLKVLDVGAVVNPLVEVYATVQSRVETLRPSKLLKPVEDEIAAAIEKVYQATGIDTVFAGINEVLDTIQSWTGLLADCRDLLNRAAEMFDQPGDATAGVQQLTADILARLDSVDMGRLQAAFDAASAAAASIERDAIARDVAMAFQTAGRSGPALLGSPEFTAVSRMVGEFPLDVLRSQRPTPSRDRLVRALESWRAAAARLEAQRPRWTTLGAQLDEAAGMVQERLLDYYRLTRNQGDAVFAEFVNPPRTTAELKETVRRALTDALTEPLTTVVVGFQAVAPYLRTGGAGLARILGAIHSKVDSIVGSGGVAGTVDAIEEAANLLRGIDLQPLTQPLDAIFRRIETALSALDPEPLRGALEAARDAIAGLLSVNTLVNQSDIDALDSTYAQALAKIEQLSPGALVAETLDPVYEDLLQDFLPILDLPAQLRLKIDEAGLSLRMEATLELRRVEEAFDRMLRAIPLDGGASAGSSAGGSLAVG